ncbi:hypothetical protein COB57_03945 [Candidatus Peregrinibacteria bacterium]|nr:MAG: hypothetical protein COB57_03945 [Candidatus Peregrinibacteria bacterium]
MKNLRQTRQNANKQERMEQKRLQSLSSKSSSFIKIFLGIALIGLAAWGIYSYESIDRGVIPKIGMVMENDQIKGNIQAKIVLTEYSDFECSACAHYDGVIKEAWGEIKDDVLFVYRNFPLQMHKHSQDAALYAEAAGKQGKFWEMHDMLFETQKEWAAEGGVNKTFYGFAEELGLDMEQFEKDLNSSEVYNKVNNDLISGRQLQLRGTPTFYINDQQIKNPRDAQAFIDIIKSFQ